MVTVTLKRHLKRYDINNTSVPRIFLHRRQFFEFFVFLVVCFSQNNRTCLSFILYRIFIISYFQLPFCESKHIQDNQQLPYLQKFSRGQIFAHFRAKNLNNQSNFLTSPTQGVTKRGNWERRSHIKDNKFQNFSQKMIDRNFIK